MANLGIHYEQALAAWLEERKWPYVAVDQHHKAFMAGQRIKSFDYLIYPPRGRKILSDVKGRKLTGSTYCRGRLGESWVGMSDVEGMLRWQEVFGAKYISVFIFAYWLIGLNAEQISTYRQDIFPFAGEYYVFRQVEINAYRLAMQRRSPGWQTVYVPRKIFRQLALPLCTRRI